MADDGPLQLPFLTSRTSRSICVPGLPRRAAGRLPQPGTGRRPRRHPGELLAATEKLLAPILARVRAGKLTGAGAIGVEVGKVISKYKTAKHFTVTITDDSLAVTRKQAQIDEEAALDGIYVIRTPVPVSELDAPAVVSAYKNLKYVERDFRHIKADDLDLRPVFHRLEERVRAHVLICMLACYLTCGLVGAACAGVAEDDEEQDRDADPGDAEQDVEGQGDGADREHQQHAEPPQGHQVAGERAEDRADHDRAGAAPRRSRTSRKRSAG